MIAHILPPELFSFLNEVDVIVGLSAVFGPPLYHTLKKYFKEHKRQIQPIQGFPRALEIAWLLSVLCFISSIWIGNDIWNLRHYIDVNPYLLFALSLSVPTAVFIPMYYSAIGDFKKYVLKTRNH